MFSSKDRIEMKVKRNDDFVITTLHFQRIFPRSRRFDPYTIYTFVAVLVSNNVVQWWIRLSTNIKFRISSSTCHIPNI